MRYVLKFRTTTNPDETLAHHGIKGQRWGRRRFQNEDGSLTDAGRKRYADNDDNSSSKSDSKTSAQDTKNSRAQAVRETFKKENDAINEKVRAMTDEKNAKLDAAVARFKKEGRYENGTLDSEGVAELRSINDKYAADMAGIRKERDAARQKMWDGLDEVDPNIMKKARGEVDEKNDNDVSDVGVIRDKWSKTDGNKPETGLVPVNKESSKEKAYDPDEIRDAPKKDSNSTADSKKKPDVVLDKDSYEDVTDSKYTQSEREARRQNIFDDVTKETSNGKTKTEKEAEEAHERAEKRAKEAEKNRKEEEAEKKKNADEREKASKEKEREEAKKERDADKREREAEKNLMEQAIEDRNKRREENMRDAKDIASSGAKLANETSKAVDNLYNPKIPRMDLSKMSNKEMQDRIQREAIERQYDQMFNVDRQRAEAGKARVTSALAAVGTVLTVGAAALDLAMKIKKARGG